MQKAAGGSMKEGEDDPAIGEDLSALLAGTHRPTARGGGRMVAGSAMSGEGHVCGSAAPGRQKSATAEVRRDQLRAQQHRHRLRGKIKQAIADGALSDLDLAALEHVLAVLEGDA